MEQLSFYTFFVLLFTFRRYGHLMMFKVSFKQENVMIFLTEAGLYVFETNAPISFPQISSYVFLNLIEIFFFCFTWMTAVLHQMEVFLTM